MNRLFIELYLDEDVDVLVGDLLRGRGFSVTTTVEAGQLGSEDAEQLAYALEHERAMVTHNRGDFETLAHEYLAEERSHWGIIIATRHPPYEVVRRLLLILNQVTAEEMKNQLRYI